MQSSWAWVLWHALGVTIKLSLVTFGASLVLSSLLAAAGISPWRALRVPTRLVVDLLRSKGLSLRHLVEKRQSLEDLFVQTVEAVEPGLDERGARRPREVGGPRPRDSRR